MPRPHSTTGNQPALAPNFATSTARSDLPRRFNPAAGLAQGLVLSPATLAEIFLGTAGRWEIFTHGGREATGIEAIGFAREVVGLGAGELLLTSMDRDGTGDGFDVELTRAIADAVPVPVIASGGVGNLDHLVQGVVEGHASAVLAASIFHFGTYTIAEAKQYMAQAGVPMRLDS